MEKKKNKQGVKRFILNTHKKTDRTEQKPMLDIQLGSTQKKKALTGQLKTKRCFHIKRLVVMQQAAIITSTWTHSHSRALPLPAQQGTESFRKAEGLSIENPDGTELG